MRLVCCLVLLLVGLQLTCALLRVGAWNIKDFGRSKANLCTPSTAKAAILTYIAKVVRLYDIIVIQEVRDSDGDKLPVVEALMTAVNQPYVNSPCQLYDYIVSGYLGSGDRKERYLFLYKTTVAYVDSYQYDTPNVFERPPFIALFRSNAGYEFALIPLHAKPAAAAQEIDALVDVVVDVNNHTNWNNTQNILLLGDFNAGCDYVTNWGNNRLRPPPFHWLIDDNAATNVASLNGPPIPPSREGRPCPYDRIVATDAMMNQTRVVQRQTAVYAEVVQFQQAIQLPGIPPIQPNQVSDHFIVEVTLQ